MFTANIIKQHKLRQPAFNHTLRMMYTKMDNTNLADEEERDIFKKVIALMSKTCYSLIESDKLLIPIPYVDDANEDVIILEMEYPNDDADYIRLVDISGGVALLQSLKDDDDGEKESR